MKIIKKAEVRPGQKMPCAKSNIINTEPTETGRALSVWYVETVEDFNKDEGYDTA